MLEIDVAVTQEDARAMASAKAGNGNSKDKRNLFLVGSQPSHDLQNVSNISSRSKTNRSQA